MGISYYLVVKDNEKKKAIIVDVGYAYDVTVSDEDIRIIDDALNRLENILDELDESEIEDRKYKDFTVKDLTDLLLLKKALDDIRYKTDINLRSDFYSIFRFYGLVSGLVIGWRSEDFDWEVVSETTIDEYVERLKKDGYEVIKWI